jgi:hypothetical protein
MTEMDDEANAKLAKLVARLKGILEELRHLSVGWSRNAIRRVKH